MSKSVVGQLVLDDRHHNRANSLEESLEATLHGKAPSTYLAAVGAPTSIQSLVSGLNFAGHVLGWQGAVEAAGLPRVKGL
eukprot:6283478-Amphidinium_carterae.1